MSKARTELKTKRGNKPLFSHFLLSFFFLLQVIGCCFFMLEDQYLFQEWSSPFFKIEDNQVSCLDAFSSSLASTQRFDQAFRKTIVANRLSDFGPLVQEITVVYSKPQQQTGTGLSHACDFSLTRNFPFVYKEHGLSSSFH